MAANVFSECFLDTVTCSEVEDIFAKEEREKTRLADGIEEVTVLNDLDKNKESEDPTKWTQYVLDDVKLLWNISVHVDIPVVEDYERMCLFNNHWSTTFEDLEILRRNLKRGVKHPGTGFLTFGGHWRPNTNTCEQEDCFFEGGHKYEDENEST